MTLAWVLGSGGLLGSALRRELQRRETPLFAPAERLRWGDESTLAGQLAAAVQAFGARAAGAGGWEIYWAAGIGTMGSSAADLAPETRAIACLLRLVAADLRLAALPGAFAFASSAGAIYAGAGDEIITELTAPAPTTAYAREKLAQEDLVRDFAGAAGGTSALLARITTVYGAGQAAGKPQGLLAHIARSIVRNRPIQIYVPFDTIRDYIAADDAAAAMVTALRADPGSERVRTCIIAAEQPTTIAEIVSIFRKIARRAPRIVTSTSRLGGVYARRVQFRSVASCAPARRPRTSLLVGIARVMAAERAAYARGARPGNPPAH